MTREEQDYYETYFEMFASKGWKQFIEDITASKESLNIETVDSVESLYHAKGQLFVINNALNFETMMRNAYDNLGEDDVESV